MKEIIYKAVRDGLDRNDAYFILFDVLILTHPFLKAYFGEYLVCKECGQPDDDSMCLNQSLHKSYLEDDWVVSWQYHAKQLVLSEDREEYLRGYL